MKPIAYRERIYDVFADPSEGIEDKVHRALAVGTDYLDVPIGFLTRIDQGTQEIVQATGDHPLIQPGETCPLESAYCRRTVEIEGILAVQDAADSSAIPDTAVQTFDLGTYIGAKVVVDGETYGTVCFADGDGRDDPFTDAEQFFVELVARLVGQAFERRAYERELTTREEQLDERQEIYRAVIDASFDLVFRIGADGRFTYVSSPVEDLLGYTPDEYVGVPFTAMLPDDETIELAEELFDRVMAGRTVEEQYFPLEHKTEGRVFVDVRVTPIYEGSVPTGERTPEDITGVQGMARDATGRHRRQRLIRVLNRVLRHNLRNDMNVISGYAATLQDRLNGEEARLAERIVDTSDRLVALGETARKLEENLEAPPTIGTEDVVPIVTRAATQIDERYPDASITIRTPEAAVARSAPRLETAVWELVDNAAKHAGEHPSVGVEVTTSDDRVVIRVTDDGPGLPDQERAVLVAGEETPLIHGSGLGLWLVHWIVESVDGDLRTRDTDSGAYIEIRLRKESESTRSAVA